MTKANLKVFQDKLSYLKENQCMIKDKMEEHHTLEPIHIIPSWDPIDRNEKPPYSYATIIAHAILSSEERKLTLSEIYNWITVNYPFYCTTSLGWQNSVRHNLSLHKSFVKIQRDASNPNHPRKGCYWTIKSGREQHFINNLESPVTKRTGRRRSSQTSVYSSIPYSAEPSAPADAVYCSSKSSKSSNGSCNNSVYTESSSSPSLCDQDFYYQTTPLPQSLFPFYRTSSFMNDSYILPYSTNPQYLTNTLYPVSPLYSPFYHHFSLFN